MSIEAMRQALEALEFDGFTPEDATHRHLHGKAIAVLRTAIAEAEKQEPVAYAVVGDGQWGEWLIGDQFETSKPPKHKYWENRGYELVPLYTPLAAQPAPVQEPVAWNSGVPLLYPEMKDGETISVEYTTPPAAQRQWVGLTLEEILETYGGPDGSDYVDYARGIEAKLKEKNNG